MKTIFRKLLLAFLLISFSGVMSVTEAAAQGRRGHPVKRHHPGKHKGHYKKRYKGKKRHYRKPPPPRRHDSRHRPPAPPLPPLPPGPRPPLPPHPPLPGR